MGGDAKTLGPSSALIRVPSVDVALLHQTLQLVKLKYTWNVEFYLELVFQHIFDVPAFAKPPRALFVRLESKPIIVRFFIHRYIFNQGLVFFF